MRRVLAALLYSLAFLLPVLIAGGLGSWASMRAAMSPAPRELVSRAEPAARPPYDPRKPTVAVVLGEGVSEVTDVLGPYALFAQSGAYNVYAVASSRALRTLTGHLDVLPHFAFAELEALLGRAPDVVVVPAMLEVGSPANRPVLEWLRKQARATLLFSWCTGAEVLAAAGVLDGKDATTHWADLGRLAARYPRVRWRAGVRYVDAGAVLTSAGLLSGIDATLYLLAKRHGPAMAQAVARRIHYPTPEFLRDPRMQPFTFRPPDGIYLLNTAFRWRKREAGVWLYAGVGELELAAIFDVHAGSFTHNLHTFGQGTVRSRHGLYLVPRYTPAGLPPVGRVLVPGAASDLDPEARGQLAARQPGAGITYLHAAPAFAFDPALQDLARQENLPTALFAAKRLEYRRRLELSGPGWPLGLLALPLLLGVTGAGCALVLRRRLGRRVGKRPLPGATSP